MSNSFILSIDRTILSATTPSQGGPGCNGNEGVLSIFQKSRTRASPSECLVSYPGHTLWLEGESDIYEEIQSMYSTSTAD